MSPRRLIAGGLRKRYRVSSVFGFSGFPLCSAYCASKFALEGLTEALQHELKPHGVKVALVEPGGRRPRFLENAECGSETKTLYESQNAGFKAFQQKLASNPQGTPPENVSRALLRLAEKQHLPMRTRVGADAMASHWMRRLFSQRLNTYLIQKLTNPQGKRSTGYFTRVRGITTNTISSHLDFVWKGASPPGWQKGGFATLAAWKPLPWINSGRPNSLVSIR